MLNDERSSEILQIQIERRRLGGLLQFSGSCLKITQLASAVISIRETCPKREAAGLDNHRKWRLLADLANLVIPHKIKPMNIQNPS